VLENCTKAVIAISIFTLAIMLMTQNFLSNLFDNSFEIIRASASTAKDPLPSWNDGKIEKAIINFVRNVTDPESISYVSVENRTATFDNDGTLWSEKPVYFQVYYVLNTIKNNETLQQIPVIKKVLANLTTNASNSSQGVDITEKDVVDMILSTVPNIPQSEYDIKLTQWIETAVHPQTGKLFKNMIFKPMVELISYLKDNNFKVFIVTGGGIDFVRALSNSVYGVPPEQVIGSSLKYAFKQTTNGTYSIFHLPEIDKVNDEYGKPENIALHSGQIPIAVGNANGDLQMFQYANDNNDNGKSLILLVHHDDPLREYSYDKKAENVLEESKRNNWNIINMIDDFKEIYPKENGTAN
jgi:phosphoglycolate phosphatase-like HAD superfamily hydrolase